MSTHNLCSEQKYEKYLEFLSKHFPFLVVKFSIYLNRRVSIMFDLQVASILGTKFRVNWPFPSGEKVQNRFSRWQPSWILDWNNFSYF